MNSSGRYPDLYAPFIYSSFLLAVFGGFFLAACLAFQISYGSGYVPLFQEIVQLHGHLQLIGWMGLLLIGVSLYVLPRLVSVAHSSSRSYRLIYLMLASGLGFRICAVVVMVFNSGSRIEPWQLMSAGMFLEATGVVLYLRTAVSSVLRSRNSRNDLHRLWPYLCAVFSGWGMLAIGNVCLGASVLGSESLLLDRAWNYLLVDVFTLLTLLPAIFGFGVKMLPVFMGLRAPLWPVKKVGILLVTCIYLYLCAELLQLCFLKTGLLEYFSAIAQAGFSVAILVYIWNLDALFFRVLPERVLLKRNRSDLHLQRGRYGDRGEYGRFELFIVCGFAWIALTALFQLVNVACLLSGLSVVVSDNTLRHALLLGGLAHLVLGVSHRLLPDLLGYSQFSPFLTGASFLLMCAASILRVVPLLLADWGMSISPHFFGVSGISGMAGIGVASLNILGRSLIMRR